VLLFGMSIGTNHGVITTDHYATEAECLAAKTAILVGYNEPDKWDFQKLKPEDILCLRVEVK
jgi:L-fucose isomerase-like protein